MKKTVILLVGTLLCIFLAASVISCDSASDEEGGSGGGSSSGPIRDDDDAELVAGGINTVLEKIRDDMDYGDIWTDYSPNGTYSVTGTATSSPIYSGALTKEYNKNFTVTFNGYSDGNGMTIESGVISYKFEDYSTSGYHLIITVSSTEDIVVEYEDDDYAIVDTLSSLRMGDTDDNRYIIWVSFRNSEGISYSVDAR